MATWQKKSTGWVEILSIFRKTSTSAWTEIQNVWRKTSTGWVKVFTRTNLPGITTFPRVRDVNGNNIDNNIYIANVGDTLYGYRGVWSNTPTSYEDRWAWSSFAGGPYSLFSPSQINTTLPTTVSWDDRYIVYQVRATNASGTSEWVSSANEAHLIKYPPFISSATITKNGVDVGGTAKLKPGDALVGAWVEDTATDTISSSYAYEWTYSNGTAAANDNGTKFYTISAADVGKSLIFKVTGTNTGGTDFASSTPTAVIEEALAVYSFSFGNTLYVGTNGYIGVDSGSSSTGVPATGRNLNIMGGKDWQMSTIYYWSNADTYAVRYDGYEYQKGGQEAFRVTYQAKFYTNQNYVDYKIIRWGSSLTMSPTAFGMYANGSLVANTYSGPFVYSPGVTMRVYYDGSIPTAYVGFTEIPAAVPNDAMLNAGAVSSGSADDGYLTLSTAANQYNPPTLTSVSASSTGTSISATFTTGADYNGHNYVIRTGSHFGTLINSGSSFSGAFAYDNLSGGTTYYVTLTPFNSQSQTGSSSQFSVTTSSNPGAFSVNSGSKFKPPTSFGTRTVTVGWSTSLNGPNYEVQLEGSSDGSTWAICTGRWPGNTVDTTLSLAGSPYFTTTSITITNVQYFKFYRATARARNSSFDSASAAYSNGGTSTSLQYYQLAGENPGTPGIGTITLGKTSASIPWTFPTNTGSNFIDWVQFSLDNSTFNNDFTTPYAFTGLTAGTAYTLYYRSLNYDGLFSSTLTSSFTTLALQPPNTPAAPTAGTTNNTSIAWSWSAPTVDSTHLAATGYEYAHTQSASTPTSGWTATTATSVTITGLSQNTTYHMHIRATNADGTSGSSSASKTTTNVVATSYTVTYSGNGNTGGTAPTAHSTTSSLTIKALPSPAFTRTNCTLGSGWNTAANGSGTNIAAGDTYTPTANITLYAKWTANSVSAAAPANFTFVGNINNNTQKQWSWSAQTSVTGGTANGYRWQLTTTNPNVAGWNGVFTEGTQTATSRTISVANASSNPRWMRVCVNITDGLGAAKNGSFTLWK
jgi:hypothetical protein